jgi:signal transduction histidine kinase
MTMSDIVGRAGQNCRSKVPRRGWLSLRFKFILWVVSVVMYMCLALGYLFIHLTESNVREELHKRGTNMARVLARESGPYVVKGEIETLAAMVRSSIEDEDVLYAEIRDSEGHALAGTGGNTVVSYGWEREDRKRSKADILEVTVPITTQYIDVPWYGGSSVTKDALKKQLGTVYMKLSTTREGTAVAMISKQLAPLMLVSCLLSIIGTVLVERRITRPVQELARATKAIASGNWGKRVTVGSNDEFGELAKSFNQMADVLMVTMVKLENYSHGLEEKVRQRTQELESSTRTLQKANVELQKLDKLKSEFISTASHELRTPLTSIKAVAEILGRQGQELPGEKTLEFLKIIESQTDRLTRMIGEILDLSHLEHDGQVVERQAVSLPDVVSEAVGSVNGIATERGVTVETQIPENLPTASSERDKTIQVLINLIGNALKFTPEGGVIEVQAQLLDGCGTWNNSPRPVSGIAVSVSDTGHGIPEEQLEAIFDKFKQIKSAALGGPAGSGLGLAISKEIVERFGGTIWAESELGKGSVFHFTMEPSEALDEEPESKAA